MMRQVRVRRWKWEVPVDIRLGGVALGRDVMNDDAMKAEPVKCTSRCRSLNWVASRSSLELRYTGSW